MDPEVLIPISLFAMVAAIVILPQYFKSKERQRTQDAVRAAIERGQPLPPEYLQALTTEVKGSVTPAPFRDVRRGVIFLAIALAFVIIGFLRGYFEGYDEGQPFWFIAVFPGLVGLAYLILGMIAGKRA